MDCCAPLCKDTALVHLTMDGDYGVFDGPLCSPHYDAIESAFPASYISSRLLVAVSYQEIMEELAEGNNLAR